MTPLRDGEGRASGFLNILRDNTKAQAEEERRALLLAEMGHRVKNALASVQAVAIEILRLDGVSAEVQRAFTDRIVALAQSHDLLTRENGEGALLAEVVARALVPYGGADRAELAGAAVRLPPNTVEILSLAFHELATNAAKYDALSMPTVHVEVRWEIRRSRTGHGRWRSSGASVAGQL
jgi:two-component sensor histidine kinase